MRARGVGGVGEVGGVGGVGGRQDSEGSVGRPTFVSMSPYLTPIQSLFNPVNSLFNLLVLLQERGVVEHDLRRRDTELEHAVIRRLGRLDSS